MNKMDSFNKENKVEKFDAEKQLDYILTEGALRPCDDTAINCEDINVLPDWYDEEKFKRGQKFFHANFFCMLLSKICGLLVILANPTILNILMYTNKSGTLVTAYKRYISTVFHVCVWYDEAFKPRSKLWQSIREVRIRHFSASKRANKNGLGRISQAEMGVTQFALMGFVLTKPEELGIFYATDEELEGFIHLWRVVGHLLGIEDRFNICRGTVQETKQLCHQIVAKSLKPQLLNTGSDFRHMSYVLIDSLIVFNLFLNYPVVLHFCNRLCDITIAEIKDETQLIKLTKVHKWQMYILELHLYLCKYYIFRMYCNFMLHLALFFITYFPFLAFFRYGIRRSYVKILQNKN